MKTAARSPFKLPAPLRSLTISKWLIVGWVCYALLPGVPLAIGYGLAWLLTRQDPSKNVALSATLIPLAVIVQISVLVGAGILLGRGVARPLAALGRASRQIAEGELDFSLPSSRVREVAEASAAFTAMGAGLRAALARQAELEQERQFFIGAIAHDLRTPLFALRGYLEGLELHVASTPEQAAHYVAVCKAKADELERLVVDLFDYTQVERMEQAVRREDFDLSDLLAKAADGLRPQAGAKGVALALDPPAAPCPLEGDPYLLTRAVENLLDNALRHTPPGGTIRLKWQAQPAGYAFSVADTGPGVTPTDLPHIFEPLYRGEASRNRATGGAGLGLAIARRILQAHGGGLIAANAPTGGAILTATLNHAAAPPAHRDHGVFGRSMRSPSTQIASTRS